MAEGTQIQLFVSPALSTPLKGDGNGNALVALSGSFSGTLDGPLATRARLLNTTGLDTVTPLGIGATFTGPSRDTANSANGSYGVAYYQVDCYADQAGTLFVEKSVNNVTWYPVNGLAGTALVAGANVMIKTPLTAQYYRSRFVNGGVAQTAFALLYNFTLA